MKHYLLIAAVVALWILPVRATAQQAVTIRVDASKNEGPLQPVWNYFGYDEPNYTYAKNGRKLIHELAALSAAPVHIRTHFLLATGDGTASFKWGSTNAYTEDASGKPVYDWTIIDRIFSTYLDAGAKPYVEIGFMPKALSSKPDPYQPYWKPGDSFQHYNLGWSYPPSNYGKWQELIYQWVRHSIEKYGQAEVENWYWEVWNEPDIGYWHGTPEEYDKLYDYTAAAVKRALPAAHIGGPATTGPANAKAAAFLKQFLEHCSSGKNYATAQQGAPLDFISFHAKGRPDVVDGHVRMGISNEMRDAAAGFAIVRSFPKFKDLPVVISEADPEGCAACSARVYPPNAYRNGTLYPAYEAVALKALLQLAASHRTNLKGVLTWAFEFEDQPYFEGFRTLATNGIDKPVLNLFRMAGLMRGNLVQAQSTGAVAVDSILKNGVREHPDIDSLVTRSDHNVSILVWNYQDNDAPGAPSRIDLRISSLPNAKRLLVRHYRIDKTHSNAYSAWKRLGSPQHPNATEYEQLEAAGQLQMLGSPHWINANSGNAEINFDFPLEALSLVQISW